MTGEIAVRSRPARDRLELLLTPGAKITLVRGALDDAAPGLLPSEGELLTDYVHPDDGARLLAALDRVADGGEAAAETLVRLCHENLCWPFIARLRRAPSGGIAASMISVHDPLPEPRQLEEILNNCPSAVLVHRAGRVLFANRAYAAINGYPSVAEVIARHRVGQNIHPDDIVLVRSRIEARLRGENPVTHYEFRLVHGDQVLWVECLSNRIEWVDGPALLAVYHDVTARKNAEGALKRSERLFSRVFADSPDALVLSTLGEGRILDANEAFLQMHGMQRGDIVGRTGLELGLWGGLQEREAFIHRLRRSGRIMDDPRKINSPSGEVRDYLIAAEVLRIDAEELLLYRYCDVTERRRAAARIAHLAHHDPLTGIANRVLFQSRLEAALERPGSFGLLSIDLDRFKEVNETFGHQIGDGVLQQVAARLGTAIRDRDTVARLGGDEFAIIQQSGRQPNSVRALAARIGQRLAEPFDVDGRSVLIGASTGIAVGPRDGQLASKLLQAADLALFRAKKASRGGVLEFRPTIALEEEARLRLESELRSAVSAAQFELHFQPVVDLLGRRAAGCEALLRWNHPERGLVRPDEFIRLAEDSGLIVPLGRWVLEQACMEAVRWPGGCKVAVNVSPVQLRREGLIEHVGAALAKSGLEPGRLELEVTESVVLQDTEEALAILRRLKRMGVSLALDDFGTGYSSMSALVRFPFDRVKIDRSFVSGLGHRSECTAIVRAVRGLCASLGLATTAEGVETEEQAQLLVSEGLIEAQGFLFSPARPANDIRGMLTAAAPA